MPEFNRYLVADRHALGVAGRIVAEVSFVAAAVAFVENVGVAHEGEETQIVVRDLDTGVEHCFCIDLSQGEMRPCG